MKADRWEKIESAWYHARNLKGQERSRFLDDLCGSDAAMRQQIEALLQQDEDPNSFLNRPAVQLLAGSLKVFTGTRVGAYEILEPIGSGNMGEVYRARDTKLHRDVALKFLPNHLAMDPDRLSRFKREAQILAALNRPNIAQIYGLEESNGTYCIAMELVDGETLAERVRRGPIPADEALRIAHDVAEALESAHEKGIIHRDLKPANVKITRDGQVKVLDFGLAKTQTSASTQNLSDSPTLSIEATNTGMIMGTAPYMSPEQARGAATDHRTDVFSFGCVLYEMLTGQSAFQGDAVSDIIASVLARDPDLSRLPADLNPKIPDLIRRCLEKDVRRRRQSIADVRVEIETILADPHGLKVGHADAHKGEWKQFIAIAVVVILTSLITAAIVWNLRRPAPESTTRLSFTLPENTRLTRTGRHNVILSPDGSRIAFVANNRLNLRNMADGTIQALAGTDEDVSEPFFSPHGDWIGFWSASDGKLKKIPLEGGSSVAICDSQNPIGASWSSDDQILIGAGPRGIQRVSAAGGNPETIISVNSDEVAGHPQILPDGERILFTLRNVRSLPVSWDQAQIAVQSLRTGVRTILVNGGADAHYVPTGHIVYARGSTLLAASFDVKSLRLGDSVPIPGDTRRGDATGAAQFSFSRNGAMVYLPVESSSATANLIDLSGTVTRLDLPSGSYADVVFSPDGKQIAMDDGSGVIWIYGLDGRSPIHKLNQESGNAFPSWTADGHLVFTSIGGGKSTLFRQPVDGSSLPEQLVKPGTFKNPVVMYLFPDGKTAIVKEIVGRTETGVQIYTLSLNGNPTPKLLFQRPGSVFGINVSHDGRWLAYEWNSNIFVQPFPPTGVPQQITTNGGNRAMWSRDSNRLFYVRADDALKGASFWSVDIRTKPTFGFGKPTLLFTLEDRLAAGVRMVDFSPATNQFVALLLPSAPASRREVQVVLNWFTDLKQRVPVK
jgi:eukaryotic-like serine/threonine-protein kinase